MHRFAGAAEKDEAADTGAGEVEGVGCLGGEVERCGSGI